MSIQLPTHTLPVITTICKTERLQSRTARTRMSYLNTYGLFGNYYFSSPAL